MTAKIKLNAASGGGSVSIQAPSSSSNNRVISLPDIADGTLVTSTSTLDATKLSGNLPAISGASLTGINSITMVDQWRPNSSFTLTGSVSLISSNWERVDAPSGYGTIGSAMTESSGVFTFPSTGIYYIEYICMLVVTSSAVRYCGNRIQTTVNNSSYPTAMETLGHVGLSNSFGAYNTTTSSILFDVTDTSTHKIRFSATSITPSATTVIGNNTSNSTAVTFIRLGDT